MDILKRNLSFQKFVIICKGRTGSSMLTRMLDSHSQIKCKGEILKDPDSEPRDEINNIYSPQYRHVKAVGFKLHYNHPGGANHDITWDLIKADSDIKIIHLHRRNVLRSHVSEIISQKTRVFQLKSEAKRPDISTRKIGLSIDEVVNLSNLYEHRRSRYNELFSDHEVLEIFYEDLVDPLSSVQRKITDFLSVDTKKMRANTSIMNPESLGDLITNFTEVEEALKSTEMEWMLYS